MNAKSSGSSLEHAWTSWTDPDSEVNRAVPAAPEGRSGVRPDTGDNSSRSPDTDSAIAYVNEQPIDRDRLLEVLLAGHGPGILEQLVVLTAAEQKAREMKIRVTEKDVQREYEASLRTLAGGATESGEDRPLDAQRAEGLLNDVLSRRNISRTEYMLGMRRNAYLRAIVLANMDFSDEILDQEHQRATGREYIVRHIQLGSLSEATEVQQKLDRGADFADLARRFSIDRQSGARGGLLEPLTLRDEWIPSVVRNTVLRMQPGEVSNPLRMPAGYQIIKLEEVRERPMAALNENRDDVERRLQSRIIEPAMQALYSSLFHQADIRINDAVLRDAYERKHGDRKVMSASVDAR